MHLRDRLRMMRPAGGPAQPAPPPGTGREGRELPAGPATGQTDGIRHQALRSILRAGAVATRVGPALCVETWYPAGYRRGAVPLDASLRIPGKGWARLARQEGWEETAAGRLVFVDTETTSLESGTGTHVFLVGTGRFVGDRFRLRQFLLPDFDEELPLLHAVLDELEGAAAMVTFNGKRFDWPLLSTRLTLARLPVPEIPHLDLLPPARRLWREVASSCRLVDLEQFVLGEHRGADVPGALVPSLYFHYLQTGDPSPLAPVLEHNRLDVLSLAALAGYLGLAAADPLAAAPTGSPLPPGELHALGRLLLDRGEMLAGTACLEEALRRGLPEPARSRCRRDLGQAYRRLGRHAEARRVWEALVAEGSRSPAPYVELAKYYEHRARDLEAAREMTLRAMAVLDERRMALGLDAVRRDLADLRHRLQRVESRLRNMPRGQGRLPLEAASPAMAEPPPAHPPGPVRPP